MEHDDEFSFTHSNELEWGKLTDILTDEGWIFVKDHYYNEKRKHMIALPKNDEEGYYYHFINGYYRWEDPITSNSLEDLFSLSRTIIDKEKWEDYCEKLPEQIIGSN